MTEEKVNAIMYKSNLGDADLALITTDSNMLPLQKLIEQVGADWRILLATDNPSFIELARQNQDLSILVESEYFPWSAVVSNLDTDDYIGMAKSLGIVIEFRDIESTLT